jgi:peptidyl-prolyl cis-trans isomerase SurA
MRAHSPASRPRPARRAAALGLAAALVAGGASGEELFVDGIVAQVGSDIVLASEVERFAAPVEKEMREVGAPDEELVKLRAELLERMIEQRLLEQAVRRAEIEATDAEIDLAIDGIGKQNGMTREQLEKTVIEQGLAWDGYREQLRREIQRQKLLSAAVQSKVRVEESELRALYSRRFAEQPQGGEEVHLRHILVPFEGEGGDAEAVACAKAEAARGQVGTGRSFGDVAREFSTVNPQYGGDIGWLHSSNLASWMSSAVGALQAGEMTPVVRSSFGCNLLQLVERREYKPKTYEQARNQLYKELFEQRAAEQYQDFVGRLREQTYIERKGVYAGAQPSLSSKPLQ